MSGVAFYFYDSADCDSDSVSSVSFYYLDTCYEPRQNATSMTTDISSLMESTWRTLSCNSTGGLPDYVTPAYFSKYYYAGDDCDATQLISVEAITTNVCVKSDSEGHYLKFTCGKP